MNIINTARLLCVGLILSFSGINLHADDWAQFGKYENQNAAVTTAPKAVFIGSSIIEGWMEQHPEFFTDNNFLSRGISGQTTYQMLLRFRDDVINLKPEVVVIYGGTNDIAENNHTYNEDRTMGNLMSMTELAMAHGIKVVLSSVLPAGSYYWKESIENVPMKIKSLNERIKTYAARNGIPYIDYYTGLADENGAMKTIYTEDGVHPNSAGYDIMQQSCAVEKCLR